MKFKVTQSLVSAYGTFLQGEIYESTNYPPAFYQSLKDSGIAAKDFYGDEVDALIRQAGSKRYIVVKTPQGYTWIDHPLKDRISFSTDTYKFEVDFDITDYETVASGVTYYVRKDGSDSNDGLTWDTAFKTVIKALNTTDRSKIYVGPGVYTRNESTQGTVITNRPVSIIGIGDVRFGQFDTLTYTLVAGKTKVYQATRSSVNKVFDSKTVDANGDYKELVKKTSVDEVDATAGSWWTDGTKVYIHNYDDRVPDAYNYAYLGIAGFTAMNGTYYLENIKFEGGSLPIKIDSNVAGQPAKLYAKNVSVKYGGTGNGWNLLGTESILVNCVAAKNLDDGFNYHLSTNLVNNCKAIEINCIGRDNGESSDTDNGSTMHDGGSIIRINGEYMRNKGGNVADVTVGTQSWNLGVKAYSSTGGGVLCVDFLMSDNSAGAINSWLEGCSTPGSTSTNGISVMNAGSAIKTRGCTFVNPTGTITTY